MMAKHDFGIMPFAPAKGERYDHYEPHVYNCISVDDDKLELVEADLAEIDFFWHAVDLPGKGLNFLGVTLIPPGSMLKCVRILEGYPGMSELRALMEKAMEAGKWMIHFGI
ncbi:MAG: hypothetical protein Q4A41_01985 [Bacillota bacterium]|nr:hypothetical protein [Bacillota bacterium]